MKKYEFLKHIGELKFRAYGKTLSEMFENCAFAVSYIFSRGGKIKSLKTKKIEISAEDYGALLYKFIEELIYLLDAEGFIVSKTDVKIDRNNLSCVVYGDDASKYKDLDAIKSPTYAEMYVRQNKGIWECQVVLDV